MITIIVIVMKKEATQRDKFQGKQVINNTTVHHQLINAHPVPQQQLVSPGNLLPVSALFIIFYDREYPFGCLCQLS